MNIFNIFIYFSNLLEKILFYEILGFPILILLLIVAALYFSFSLKFPAVKHFKNAFNSMKSNENEDGLLKSTQSLFTSLSSVIGMGSIAGVATAIYIGGPGAIFWLVIIAFFAMNMSFAETLLAAKYKNVDKEQKSVECAPVSYIRGTFKDLNLKKFGIILSVIYAVLYFIGLLGTQAYQIEETVNLLTEFEIFMKYRVLIIILLDILILVIVYGGITKIAKIFDKSLPIVCSIYLISIFIILLFNITKIPGAILTIIKDAFTLQSATGGIIGAICTGVKRGIYSNESGLGSATTPYAAMKSNNYIKQAAIGALNPFFVSIICFLTGLVIIVSGTYLNVDGANGIILTKNAFATVFPWFPYILSIIILILSISICISSAFNAENVYLYYFSKKTIFIYILLQFSILMCGVFFDLNQIIDMADTLYLSIGLPNLICLFSARKIIKQIYQKTI